MADRLQTGDIYHHFFGFTGLSVGLILGNRVSLSIFFERKNPLMFATAIAALLNEGKLEGWKIGVLGKGTLDEKIRFLLFLPIEAGRVEVGFSSNLEEELLKSKIYVSIISTGNNPSQSAF